MEMHVFCCERCGEIFESAGYAAKWCEKCRVIERRERDKRYDMTTRKQHVIRHEEQPLLGTTKKRREHQERARAVQLSMNEVLKKAAENGLSYGVTVAKLRDGKI